jgi:hypothetical protein
VLVVALGGTRRQILAGLHKPLVEVDAARETVQFKIVAFKTDAVQPRIVVQLHKINATLARAFIAYHTIKETYLDMFGDDIHSAVFVYLRAGKPVRRARDEQVGRLITEATATYVPGRDGSARKSLGSRWMRHVVASHVDNLAQLSGTHEAREALRALQELGVIEDEDVDGAGAHAAAAMHSLATRKRVYNVNTHDLSRTYRSVWAAFMGSGAVPASRAALLELATRRCNAIAAVTEPDGAGRRVRLTTLPGPPRAQHDAGGADTGAGVGLDTDADDVVSESDMPLTALFGARACVHARVARRAASID